MLLRDTIPLNSDCLGNDAGFLKFLDCKFVRYSEQPFRHECVEIFCLRAIHPKSLSDLIRGAALKFAKCALNRLFEKDVLPCRFKHWCGYNLFQNIASVDVLHVRLLERERSRLRCRSICLRPALRTACTLPRGTDVARLPFGKL